MYTYIPTRVLYIYTLSPCSEKTDGVEGIVLAIKKVEGEGKGRQLATSALLSALYTNIINFSKGKFMLQHKIETHRFPR